MAPPTKTVPHPGRALAVLFVLIVAMLLGILGTSLFSPSAWPHRFRVGLGLDLSSGTQVTMSATTPNGKIPSSSEMSAAISVIESRVNGTGNSGAQVQPQGDNLLIVTVPGKGSAQTIQLVSAQALLLFRQVLLFEPYTSSASASASPSPSASPSASASSTAPGVKASSSPTGTASPSPTASATSTAKTSAKIIPDATASPTPTPTTGASASASPKASATATPSPSPSATSSPAVSSSASGDASLVNAKTLALFNKLNCTPGNTALWKTQVGYTDTASYDTQNTQIVSCGYDVNADGQLVWGKFALDKAKVLGSWVTQATAALSTTNNWQVNLTLNSQGTSAFSALTSHLYDTYYGGYQAGDIDDTYLDQDAIVLDGNVVSAPDIESAIPGGNAQITGQFTQAQATQLQNELKYGSLPLSFKVLYEDSVSAQVGRVQLDGGLIAAAIGMFLVIVYAFVYYRGLGIVSVSSLTIAALIAYMAVVLLSRYQNFVLELSGIAGLIVAVGITADSFVVFFERLRDEVREGKQLRPAVEAGWKRARRTILVSDTVSFLAALLLYYFAIGEVKGFAYTLGLTTIIDVVVVFLFTKPMVTILAGTRFYGNGHPLSGLDPKRLGARAPWRSSVRRETVRRHPHGAVTRTGGS